MSRNLVFILLAALIISSCTQKQENFPVSITGKFPALVGQELFLSEMEPMKSVPLDSITISNEGEFEFNINIEEAGFFILQTSGNNNIILQLDKEDKVYVLANSEKFYDGYTVTGSPGSELLWEFENQLTSVRKNMDSLATVYNSARGDKNYTTIKDEVDSLYKVYFMDHKQYVIDFIQQHAGSLTTLLVINRKMGNKEVLDEMKDFRYFHLTDSMLQITYSGNKHTQDHHQRVKKLKNKVFDEYVKEEKLSRGKRPPDIILNDTAGEPVSLKSYSGEFVIVYFWAGWDAQSRRDNRILIQRYQELKSNRVEILGVSLDENAVVWKGAVKIDKLPWPQVSELAGFYSEVKRSYNVPDELPFYYLISPDQKIMYKHAVMDSVLLKLRKNNVHLNF